MSEPGEKPAEKPAEKRPTYEQVMDGLTPENVASQVEPLAWALLDMAVDAISKGKGVPPTVFGVVVEDGQVKLVVNMVMESVNKEAQRRLYRNQIWPTLMAMNPVAMFAVNDSYAMSIDSVSESELYTGTLADRYEAGDPRVMETVAVVVYPRGGHAWAVYRDYDRRSSAAGDLLVIDWKPERVNRNETGDTIAGACAPEPWVRQAEKSLDEQYRAEKAGEAGRPRHRHTKFN